MIQHDVTKWTINDLYGQCIHVHPLAIPWMFVTRSCFCKYFYNYQVSTHYLPNVLNQGNFKTMILYAEKTHAIKFQHIVMVPFGDTKIRYMALWGIFDEFLKLFKHWSWPSFWTFILNDHRLWHVTQSKSTMWHINCTLEKIFIYLFE